MTQLTREQLVAELADEQQALETLVGTISDEQWYAASRADGWRIHDIVAHVGDAAYGLAYLAKNPTPPGPNAPSPEQVMAFINQRNDQRREKLATLERAEIERRIATGFEAARTAAEQLTDLHTPTAGGPAASVGGLLQRAAQHSALHRQDIEQLLER